MATSSLARRQIVLDCTVAPGYQFVNDVSGYKWTFDLERAALLEGVVSLRLVAYSFEGVRGDADLSVVPAITSTISIHKVGMGDATTAENGTVENIPACYPYVFVDVSSTKGRSPKALCTFSDKIDTGIVSRVGGERIGQIYEAPGIALPLKQRGSFYADIPDGGYEFVEDIEGPSNMSKIYVTVTAPRQQGGRFDLSQTVPMYPTDAETGTVELLSFMRMVLFLEATVSTTQVGERQPIERLIASRPEETLAGVESTGGAHTAAVRRLLQKNQLSLGIRQRYFP